MAEKELKNRVASVKNVQKITRAMEMISAARLRRAEQRIASLRPYASAVRRMTRHAAQAAEHLPSLPILDEHESVDNVGLMLVTSDRGLAGAFNGQIIRAGVAAANELERGGKGAVFSASGRRGVGSLTFRKRTPVGAYVGFTDRPAYANAREIAADLITAYVDGEVDQVDLFYNSYISPLQQKVTRETLLPLQHATILERGPWDEDEERREDEHTARGAGRVRAGSRGHPRAADPGLRGDLDLPRAARVDRVRARRADDRDAQRVGERRGPHRDVHPADEPPAPGGHHAGDHGSRGRRGSLV